MRSSSLPSTSRVARQAITLVAALADASARLEAAWTSWRRDRALHERAERVAIATLATR